MLDQANRPSIKVNIVVPLILFLMVFSLVIDNSFKIIQPELVAAFGVDAATVSWQVTLAGLIIGIGAIVYAALSDAISIRRLLIAGIVFICVGSGIGYVVHENYIFVVVARIIQAAGLGATETLYLITVAKYLSADQQKKYMGFSTASFQIATVIGMLTGGFIATYMVWYNLFLVPMLTIVLIPFVWKYLPEDKGSASHVDVIGMILVGALATTVLLCISNFSWWIFAGFVLACIAFFAYIAKVPTAFINITFFQNKLYVFVLLIAFVLYNVQAAYGLSTFSFLLTSIYNVKLDVVSEMFIPACMGAALVGALSGKIGSYFTSKQCIYTGIILIIASVWASMLFIGSSILLFAIVLITFSAAYALLYAPLIDTALKQVPVEKAGTALGFYNLFISISMSIGFTCSAVLIDRNYITLAFYGDGLKDHYTAVLFIIGLIGVAGLAIYHFLVVPIVNRLAKG